MAIKERKQITGTTEQINAYAGHEGQIVWDKEKKTLVGMSGTAGENYPLASKEYADSKYLPLTGGVMVGAIMHDPNYDELFIGHDYDTKSGACLALRSSNKKDHDTKGTFALAARTPEQEMWLVGEPGGDLWWGPTRVTSLQSVGGNWVRYSDGLQLCWGGILIPANSFNAVVNLPVPYANSGYIVTAIYTDSYTAPSVSVAVGNKTPNAFSTAAANPQYSWNRFCEWITIGFWK